MKQFTLETEFSDKFSERGLIASVSRDPKLLSQVGDMLPAGVFWEERDAWEAVADAIKHGQQSPLLPEWEPATDPLSCAQHLKDLFLRRFVAHTLDEVAQQLYDQAKPAQSLLARMEESVARARSAFERMKVGRLLWATEVLPKVMESAEARELERKRTGKPVMGLLTGIKRLDEILGGLNAGLYLLGGPPGVGKTSLGLQVSNVVARGTPLLYVTFESSAENLTLKAICERAGINPQDVRRGTADLKHLAAVAIEWLRDVASRLAFIEGTVSLSVPDLRARAVEAMTRHKLGRCLIVVDYLQIWAKGGIAYRGLETARSRVETFGAELRELAMSLKSPVLAISSQSRQQGSYGDGTGKTSLDSFKESGGLEYACDVALFLVGSKKRTATSPARALELDIRKNRDGDTGVVHLIFRPDISRFWEEERDV